MAGSEQDAHKLGPTMLHELSKHGVARLFRERTVLVTEGEKTDALYIILEGRVRAYVSDASGREAVLSIMGPGEYFGEIALDEGPRSGAIITAVKGGRIYVALAIAFDRQGSVGANDVIPIAQAQAAFA